MCCFSMHHKIIMCKLTAYLNPLVKTAVSMTPLRLIGTLTMTTVNIELMPVLHLNLCITVTSDIFIICQSYYPYPTPG